ncbi:hypothetical protein [Nocardioides piscis]|uniref:Uncharacterized protein n=1 Tax=Nocardioides piscis TaxID=2714938 RepID=A0A6G7YC05_9ACTN|nr:hypothetical protein [Nocardioides piscis]QIK74206.1 hypothetical protein G7071_00880 [Nocardioides piscis]
MAGNPTCVGQGYDYGFKTNAGGDEDAAGTFDDPNSGVVVTWSYAGTSNSTINWSSNTAVSAVIVKGGDAGNVHAYDPAVLSDSGLRTPLKNDGYPGVSHVEFCFNYNVTVTKTANTSFTRTYTWGIDKTGSETSLTLSAGQTHPVNYTVTTTRTHADSNFVVSGTITVSNPWPIAATALQVSDSLAGAVVDCGGATTVPANGSVQCTYSASVASNTGGTNTATASAIFTTARRSATGSAPYTFGSTPSAEIDECITVTDTLQGPLGQTCQPRIFTYTRNVGPYASPGVYTVRNVASFVTNDTGTTGSDDHTVTITVPGGGCTLTQGYWKTHSAEGPAPYDDGWLAIGAAQEDTPFYSSGKTWLQVFSTPPAGNAYYILAHQYMAAKLNVLNGATAPAAVTSALTSAESLFSSVGGTTLTKAQTTTAKQLAGVLGSFNEGGTGPGHCDE